jgi:hypothetical protein
MAQLAALAAVVLTVALVQQELLDKEMLVVMLQTQ